jgi:hypothetical protein
MFLLELISSRASATPYLSLRRDGRLAKRMDGDVGMERFASESDNAPAELSAAGMTTSDLSAS